MTRMPGPGRSSAARAAMTGDRMARRPPLTALLPRAPRRTARTRLALTGHGATTAAATALPSALRGRVRTVQVPMARVPMARVPMARRQMPMLRRAKLARRAVTTGRVESDRTVGVRKASARKVAGHSATAPKAIVRKASAHRVVDPSAIARPAATASAAGARRGRARTASASSAARLSPPRKRRSRATALLIPTRPLPSSRRSRPALRRRAKSPERANACRAPAPRQMAVVRARR